MLLASDPQALIAFAMVIFFSCILGGITGFGNTIVALPFTIMIFDLETGRTVLTATALIQSLVIALKDRRSIAVPILVSVVIFMGIGLPAGMFTYRYLPQDILITILAIFTGLVAIRGLLVFFLKVKRTEKTHAAGEGALRIFLVLAGIIHGAFSSGGPLLVIYTMEKIREKTVFRATMCAIWSILNTALMLQFFAARQVSVFSLKLLVFSLPFLAGGIILGNLVNRRIRDTVFTPLVCCVLLVVAGFMLWNQSHKL